MPNELNVLPRNPACPSDDAFRNLLAGLPASEQGDVVAHLDQCASCCERLERIAGDEAFRQRACECLQDAGDEVAPLPAVLQAKLSTWRGLTHATHDTLDEELTLAFLQPSANPAALGRLDRYEVIGVLGRGGMGLVLKARDPMLERLVAIKVMACPAAAVARQRFRREARAAAAVSSDATVAIYEVQDSGEVPYIVMEYVEGRSLQDALDRHERLAIDDVLRIGAQVARGLAAAHEQGLIHRDVKPGNILLDAKTGNAKIGDFGLARAVDDTSLTACGALAGTPEYMSPEQAAGTKVDSAADLFSLGGVLYAMCAGRPPFAGEGTLAVLRMISEEQPPALQELRPDVPARLVRVIETLLSKSPRDRGYTAMQLAEELEAMRRNLNDEPLADVPRRTGRRRLFRRSAWVATASTLLVVLAAVACGEAARLWDIIPPLATQLALDDSQDGQAAAPSDEVKAPDGSSSKPDRHPLRVQILPRNALMKEAIQEEKDNLPDVLSPLLVKKLEGHTGPVSGLAFTPKGDQIVSCSGWPSGDRTIRLWDIATGRVARQFDTAKMPKNPGVSGAREAPGELQCLALSPEGDFAVTGATGGATSVWNVATGELKQLIDGHLATVYGVAVAPDGRRVLSCGRESTVRLWKTETGELIYALKAGGSWVRSVAISPDGNRGLSGGYDGTLRLWDLETGKQLREMRGGKEWVWSCAFAHDGKAAASVCGSAVILWDLENGKEIRRFTGHTGPITCVAFSPDGRQLATASYDQTVRLWHVATGRQEQVYSGHRDWVWRVVFSPDGRQIASAGGGREAPVDGTVPGIDFEIRLWKVP